MKTSLHRAETRGYANHGWLETQHTFSFANYYNPNRMNFGMLRVLNDDRIAGGKGFGKHPHDNMEIITIPLRGALEHKDSMGNHSVIRNGEIQVMSAGTGIFHSEFNADDNEEVELLQIWIFPDQKEVTPRYQQVAIRDMTRPDELCQILSPFAGDAGVCIYQNAWFHLGDFGRPWQGNYRIKAGGNGVYIFVIEGEAEVAGEKLKRRDGLGVSEADSVDISTAENTKLLLIEVPMR